MVSFLPSQAMERLDQRCCTEAIELRAQLRCAQQRFVEQRQLREELRRELQADGAPGLEELWEVEL